jgi:hypothetical protein
LGAAAAVGLLGIPASPEIAEAKSAYFEIRDRCPCAGPTAGTFWRSQDERMACVDAVIADLVADQWPEQLLSRDRRRELRSHCGVPRFQCDGTRPRSCPGRTMCQAADAFCAPGGVPSVCLSRREVRRWSGCDSGPSACSCDGVTYDSVCALWRAGATLAHEGRCSEGCAGPDHLSCPAGTYCFTGACGDDGAWGRCVTPPQPCYPTPGPACGCDGITYLDDCAAFFAGVMVRHFGPCEGG